MDSGEDAIADQAELAQVRRQARRTNIKSVVAAAVVTALTVVL